MGGLHAAKVDAIRKRLLQGASVRDVAEEHNVSYHVAYRIARGETWREAGPIAMNKNGRRRETPFAKQYLIWYARTIAKLSFKEISGRYQVSDSTARRLFVEFRLMLAHRISTISLESGGYQAVMRKYGLDHASASELDALSMKTTLTSRQRWLVEHKFPELEKIRARK